MTSPRIDRRTFVCSCASLFGLAVLDSAGCHLKSCLPGSKRPLTFDEHAWATIDAATARLLPTDATPGAREANVTAYIDRQLSEPHFTLFKREFIVGVQALNFVATARHGAMFARLEGAEQDSVLSALEKGQADTEGFASAHFFAVLLTLTLEGFLADPKYGGNRNRVGWSVVGLEQACGTHDHGG